MKTTQNDVMHVAGSGVAVLLCHKIKSFEAPDVIKDQ